MEYEPIIIIMEIFIVGNGKAVIEQEKEFFIGMQKNGKVINMKEVGKIMKEMEMENRKSQNVRLITNQKNINFLYLSL